MAKFATLFVIAYMPIKRACGKFRKPPYPRGKSARKRKGLQLFNFYVTAKHVGVGIGGSAQKILIVGADGEKGGVNPRKYAAIADAFISA